MTKVASGMTEVIAVHTDRLAGILRDVAGVSARLLESVDAVAAQLLLHFNTIFARVRAAQYHPRSRLMRSATKTTVSLKNVRAVYDCLTRFTQNAPLQFQVRARHRAVASAATEL